ncbi:HAD family hydrolase [Dokdonella sp.]|uniref:HAD family hydrolase n=1 Tax=Dokdonella sp. TaxID=2291710 RepID=UPI001B14C557|nr:HAD family hydrolase [Dokdonella sp.]MBO9663385.1 HAD family hydrolase [Dokdonella sp.]
MIELVGFDGDDTLWHSEGYYQHAGAEFERILAAWIDIGDASVRSRLHAAERRNLALFGYGAKSMTLSMVEAAIELTNGAISAGDIHRIVVLGKSILEHPVELLPDIRAAVEAVAARHRIVLITKGDLFHQERKVAQSGLGDLFERIEIVSEKDARSYARVIAECDTVAARFAMIGNSLRSDVEPVIELGGWGIHMPYHVTWAHELEHGVDGAHPRVLTIDAPSAIPEAVARCDAAGHTEAAA